MATSTGGWFEDPNTKNQRPSAGSGSGAKIGTDAGIGTETGSGTDAGPSTGDAPLATVSYFPGVKPAETDAGPESVTDAASERTFPEAAPTASEKAAARRADRAANVSMNALTRRGMSRWELEQILVSRELEPDEVEAELDRLAGVGLIDDAALAETIVRTHHERKGLGRSALVAEMRRRHIDADQIEESLAQLDGDSELTRAKELAHKRAPQLRSLDQTTAKRRLTAFLMRKGYSSSVIREAVDEALDAGGSTVRFR